MLICVNIFLEIYSSIYYPLFQYLLSLIPVSTEGHGRYYYTPLQAIPMEGWQCVECVCCGKISNLKSQFFVLNFRPSVIFILLYIYNIYIIYI
ncbi:hypothetical protein SAMN04487852_101307 [Prevotella sp. tf2-5]|nr:hypothetical protein SAMN04487852_101307 [Prevotella sp. tf2-5]